MAPKPALGLPQQVFPRDMPTTKSLTFDIGQTTSSLLVTAINIQQHNCFFLFKI